MIHFTSSDEEITAFLKQSSSFEAVCRGNESSRVAFNVDGIVFYVFRESESLCLALAYQELTFSYEKIINPFMCRFATIMQAVSNMRVIGV